MPISLILACTIQLIKESVYASIASYCVLFKKASFSFHLPGKRYEKADIEVVAAWGKSNTRLEEAFSDPDAVILCEYEMHSPNPSAAGMNNIHN